MKLNEWKDSKGNKVTTSPASTATSSGSFKKRFEKLLDYASTHKGPAVHKTTIKSLSDDGFFYTEEKRGGYSFYDVDINVYIGTLTEAWRLRVYIDNRLDVDLSGQGWTSLLKELRQYITVPVVSTPEYKDLLTEWLDSTGKKVNLNTSSAPAKASSKTNKEKFTSLLYYMKKNKSSDVYKVEVTRLDDGGFTYKEYRKKSTGYEYTLTISVGYSRFNSQWKYELYMDQSLIEEKSGSGFNELVNNLYAYFNTPKPGTKEYQSLCEWVDKSGKTVHINNSSTPVQNTSQTPVGKIPDQTYRYRRLLAQIDADGFCKYTINLLDNTTLDITLHNNVRVKLVRQPHFPIYKLSIEDTSMTYDDYEDVLNALIEEGIIGDTDLCEAASFVEEFKEYENLWD